MADERIDIVVTDKGSDAAATAIRSIGTEAKNASTYLERLQLQLATINTSAVEKLAAAANINTNALVKQGLAQEKLNLVSNQSALAAQKLATEQARTAAASAQAALVASKAEAATLRLAAANVKLAADSAAATAALETEAAAQARIAAMVEKSIAQNALQNAASLKPLGAAGASGEAANLAAIAAAAPKATAAIKETEAEVAVLASRAPGLFASFKNSALGAFDAVRDFVTGNGTRFRGVASEIGTGAEEMGEKVAKATPHIKGNSTAIRELLVIAREGGRGDFTRMAGSVSILAGALGILEAAIPLAIAGIVALVAAKYTLNTEVEKKSLENYANTLGLTEKEMRKLSDTTVSASGKLKEHNELQITFGDVLSGTLKTIEQSGSAIAATMGLTTREAKNAVTTVISFLQSFFAYIVGGVYAFAKFLYTEVYNLFIAAQNVGTLVANAIYTSLAVVANGIIILFNGVGAVINFASNAIGKGDAVKHIDLLDVSIGRLGKGVKNFKGENLFGDIKAGAQATNAFFDQAGKNIDAAARARIKAKADAIENNRNPTKGRTSDPKTQADYLNDENKKLDDQLRRMGMLKEAREVQQQLDTIEEAFIKRRMPLSAAQLKGFKDKIVAIQEGKRVQSEFDHIYEESTGVLEKYNDTVKAANALLAMHAITQLEATVAINAANRALQAHNDLIGANAPDRAFAEAQDKIALSLERGGIVQAQANQQTVIATRAHQAAVDPLFKMNEQLDVQAASLGLVGNAIQEQTIYEQARQQMLLKGITLDATYTRGQNAAVDALMARNKVLQAQTDLNSKVTSIVNPILDKAREINSEKLFYAAIDARRKKDVLDEYQAQQAKAAYWVKANEEKLGTTADFFGTLATLTKNGSGAVGAISKAAAVAEATINGYVAVQKALAGPPYPFNLIAAAAVAIKTGAQVAGILSTNAGSFANGGQFMIEGKSGVDANNINMNVTRGERVTVETAAQQRANDKGSNASPVVNVMPKIVNVFDEKSFVAAMDSEDGKQVISNVIRRHRSEFASLLGQH
jgi:hypothetical protein